MPRVNLTRRLLAAAGVTVLVAVLGGPSQSGMQLVSDDPGTAVGVTAAPPVVVHEAPTQLELHQDGLVRVKAGPPAIPGDVVVLNTAGPYNSGFVRISESVLGNDLTATLRVGGRDFLGSYNYWAAVPATATHAEGVSPTFPIAIVSPRPQQSPSCGGAAPRKADGRTWTCTYDDEFSGLELDRRYWVPQKTETSGFTTGNQLTYACALDDPATVAVRGGNLELSLVDLGQPRSCGQNYTSRYAFGQVMQYQTYSQTYGKYEVRAKIPDLRMPGSQQSFWLWPDADSYGPWPASGELDFAEMYSNVPGVDRPFIHYLPGTRNSPNENLTTADCPIRVGQYNTYGVEWTPGRITILLNGKVCMVNDYSSLVAGGGSPAPFDHPFYLALNQAMGAVGNDYSANVPSRLTTKVDYVRVWR